MDLTSNLIALWRVGDIYHLFVWSNFNFLHNSLCITLPTQLCQLLNSFCANLLHSLIMWLIVSSLLPHNLHLLFFASYIWLVFMTLLLFTPWEFFTSANADGLSLEFEWQKVSSSLTILAVLNNAVVWSSFVLRLPIPPVPLIVL